MSVLLSNNAQGSLSAAITNVQLSILLGAGEGGLFPVVVAPDYFMATLINAANQLEIVKVTARSADTLTVVRGQEGTTARAYGIGDKLECRMTAGGFANKADKDTAQTFASHVTVGGNLAVNGSTTFGDTAGDSVVFVAGLMTIPAGGIVASGGTVNFATGLQVLGVAVVSTTASQTLTNKTLTTPTIAAFLNGGTMTMPSGSDTIVARSTVDTLSNKTFVSPALGTPISGNLANCLNLPVGALTGAVAIANGGTGATTQAGALTNLGISRGSSAITTGYLLSGVGYATLSGTSMTDRFSNGYSIGRTGVGVFDITLDVPPGSTVTYGVLAMAGHGSLAVVAEETSRLGDTVTITCRQCTNNNAIDPTSLNIFIFTNS